MYYPDELIEEIRSRNDIVDVISSYVSLKKRGSVYVGLCPFHSEKTPSFTVDRRKGLYICFGCGAGGNLFNFLMEYEGMTFLEAVQDMAKRGGVELPTPEYSREDGERQSKKDSLYDMYRMAAKFYHYQLYSPSGQRALDYFKNRGLTNDTIKRFGLGYSLSYGNSLYKYIKKEGYSDSLMLESGLFLMDARRGISDRFWNRVMYPIMDVNRRVIAFGGRVTGKGEPKYINSPETLIFDKSRNLYGLNYARRSKREYFILCEGYMDVISLHQAGFDCALASLGTAFTLQQANIIGRYTKDVRLLYDSDAAGVKAAMKAISILKSKDIAVKVVDVKPHKDPDEFINAMGADAFEDRLSSGENSLFFELDNIRSKYSDINDPEQKTDFMHVICRKLLEISDDIKRENYLNDICTRFFLNKEVMRSALGKLAVVGFKGEDYEEPKALPKKKEKADPAAVKRQGELISWIVSKPEIFPQIKKYISPEDFTDEPYRSAFRLIYEQLENDNVNLAELLNHFPDSEEQKKLAKLFSESLPEGDDTKPWRILGEIIYKVKRHSLDVALKSLDGGDAAQLQQLMTQKKDIEYMANNLDFLNIK